MTRTFNTLTCLRGLSRPLKHEPSQMMHDEALSGQLCVQAAHSSMLLVLARQQ